MKQLNSYNFLSPKKI